jgi:SPP1 gp7 family putative phage head morphogenesis protein
VIPLKDFTRRTRPRAKSITLREIVPTKAQSDDLAAIYLAIVRHWRDVGANVLAVYDPPAITTDSPPEIESALAQGQRTADALIIALSARTSSWIDRLALWHTRRWGANVLSGTGVSIDAWLTNAAIADDMAASLAWNTGLIRNVSDQARDRISNAVWAGYRARTPRRDIARAINEAVGLGRDRARRIAVDQTTKLAGAMDRSRMLEAGLNDWLWRHSGKAHPRQDHVARNGKRYTWQNPPADIPGELPFCGCKAQGVVDLS